MARINPFCFIVLSLLAGVQGVSAQNTLEPAHEEDSSGTELIIEKEEGDSEKRKAKSEKGKVLLIPFEPKLYMSDIDHQVAEETQLEPRQIKKRIRFGLDNEISAAIEKRYPVISFVRENDPEKNEDLKYIYRSVGYQYTPVPKEDLPGNKKEEESGAEKFFKKLSGKDEEKEQEEQDGDVMEEGQIKDPGPDDRERFMKASPVNPGLFPFIQRNYEEAMYYLFITELDIKLKAAPGQPAQRKESYDRMIKVHYTLFDRFGNVIDASAAMVPLSADVNDLNGIIKDHLRVAGSMISSRIPGPEADSTEDSEREPSVRGDEVYGPDEDY